MLDRILNLAETAMAASTPLEVSDAFQRALAPHGISYYQSRLYRRPGGSLTARAHWDAGGVVQRVARPGWVGSSGYDYICFECNPLLRPIRESRTRYRFSDFAPRASRSYGTYWEALGEAGMKDALCATAYGPDRTIASFHIGIDDADPAPDTVLSMQTAALIVAERMIAQAPGALPPAPDLPHGHETALSARERDALAFVAEGKTDWEIGKILGVAESTARFHVDNARRKLGAVNRAHAVARFLAAGAGPIPG